MEKLIPDYKRIYNDIIMKKFPDKRTCCMRLLQKESLSVVDIIELNEKIFGIPDKETFAANQRCRSYKKRDILKMLDYQKKKQLNNTQLAIHFKLSRNTVAKWKKKYVI
ncbi:helix-turn-helix domain-containing protein [Chryseobacterium sp. RP-3-3]|uniref:Helix-turn-helix domain-containing protein n=1 Tax=Chryseobacterium antibioticum TaxID=2728847 RepID=A0A7Y0AS23_9FLAO|nr:helix-turn-helix domain-containing protein [Chryseobacterium antibioticum]NML72456.1 helix-turn-helix domain-containing protein [Chryseobacterium antibioticum]